MAELSAVATKIKVLEERLDTISITLQKGLGGMQELVRADRDPLDVPGCSSVCVCVLSSRTRGVVCHQ